MSLSCLLLITVLRFTISQEICPCESYDLIEKECLQFIQQCNTQIDNWVVGFKKPAKLTDWPYIVSLQISSTVKGAGCYSHFCGGVLIAPNLVLSAAHCYDRFLTGQKQGRLRFKAYAAHVPSCRHLGSSRGSIISARSQVNQVYLHPEWNRSTVQTDLAILVLADSLPGPYINLSSEFISPQNQTITIAGYGAITSQEHSDRIQYQMRQLYYAELDYISEQQCGILLDQLQPGTSGGLNYKSMMCGYNRNAVTCKGDSGSPAVFKGATPNEDVLVGVTSWGPFGQCSSLDKDQAPKILARVSAFKDWIDGIVANYSQNVCNQWNDSDNADFSYFVEISVEISKFAADHSRFDVTFSRNNSPELKKQFENSNCFDIKNLKDTQIQIRSVAGNCVNGSTDQDYPLFTVPEFGVIYKDFKEYNINILGYNKTVHINDFLLLKLRDSFEDVPLELAKLSVLDFNDTNGSYEIFSQVQNDYNYSQLLEKMEVQSELSNGTFLCSENFTKLVCRQDQQVCAQQEYFCGQFTLPDYAQLHSGDPLVRKQDSIDTEIFGFFSTDFIPENYRKYYKGFSRTYYVHQPGNYSFDANGAVFVGFTEKVIKWINFVTNQYSENLCTEVDYSLFDPIAAPELPVKAKADRKNIILISVLGSVFFSAVVVVSIFGWRVYKSKKQAGKQKRGQGSVRLDPIDMMDFEEILQSNQSSILDSSISSSPDWWSNIALPQGVRDIPISHLVGTRRLGAGGFAVVSTQSRFEGKQI